MYVLTTLLLLLLAAATLMLLRLSRRVVSYSWLVAAIGILLAWVSLFFWQFSLPSVILSGSWIALPGLPSSLEFLVNEYAWVYALSLTALAGAVVLSSPARIATVGPAEWAGTLILLALAILSLLADNPLTLVLAWTAIDLVEVFTMLRSSNSASLSERTVVLFSVRALGTGFALWAGLVSLASGQVFLFENTPSGAGIFLLLAAGLRLGVLPLHLPYRHEPVLRRGFGTSLRLTTAVTSLVLLARLPVAAIQAVYLPYLLGFVAVAALYAAWKWVSASDELSGRPYWIIGMSALAVSAALRGNPTGSVAWGASMVLFGGLSFLFSARQIWFTRFLAICGLLFLSFPLTLTASGWLGDFPWTVLFWPPFLVAHLLLAGGYFRHLLRPGELPFAELPRWAQAAYPVGLALLVITALVLGFWGWPGAFQLGAWIISVSLALLAVLVGLAALRFRRLITAQPPQPVAEARQSSFGIFQERLAGLLWSLFRAFGRLMGFAASLLEGDGGLLWTLLLLVLFISLLWRGGAR